MPPTPSRKRRELRASCSPRCLIPKPPSSPPPNLAPTSNLPSHLIPSLSPYLSAKTPNTPTFTLLPSPTLPSLLLYNSSLHHLFLLARETKNADVLIHTIKRRIIPARVCRRVGGNELWDVANWLPVVVIQVEENPNGGVEEGADVMAGGEVPEKVHYRGEETSA